jgi:hypothetical protein
VNKDIKLFPFMVELPKYPPIAIVMLQRMYEIFILEERVFLGA